MSGRYTVKETIETTGGNTFKLVEYKGIGTVGVRRNDEAYGSDKNAKKIMAGARANEKPTKTGTDKVDWSESQAEKSDYMGNQIDEVYKWAIDIGAVDVRDFNLEYWTEEILKVVRNELQNQYEAMSVNFWYTIYRDDGTVVESFMRTKRLRSSAEAQLVLEIENKYTSIYEIYEREYKLVEINALGVVGLNYTK